MERRIRAFMQLKRNELDMINVQEFCQRANMLGVDFSCARTDAVLIKSKGSKGHLKSKLFLFTCFFNINFI